MSVNAKNKEDYIQRINQCVGVKQLNKNIFEVLEKLREISFSHGLSESDLYTLCDFFINTKLDSRHRISLLYCLIPESKLPKDLLKKMLFWFFQEIGTNTITRSVEKQFLKWLIGIVHCESTDLNTVDSFYYSFIFLLSRPHILGLVCKLLHIISKPEDAKRWVVQQVIKIHIVNGSKSHTASVLSLLKSYKPEVVPEKIPVVNYSFEISKDFEKGFNNLHFRNLHQIEKMKNEDIKWNSWHMFQDKKLLPRIIPPPENLNLSDGHLFREKKMSIIDVKTMASLGANHFKIEYPAQVLSLLANQAGFYFLAFGDEVIKTRFFHTLYHVLCKVFLLDILPYSDEEKIHFLSAIKAFQEYAHQSIPVVTNFLFSFILTWDGEDYMTEIFGLLEWMELRPEEDLRTHILRPLKQIFLSSAANVRCLIIKTMGKMLKNWLVMDKREKNFFQSHYETCNLVKLFEVVCSFVGELITTGLIWNNEKKSRNFLMTALDFYEVTQAIERAGDMPTIVIMPPSLVYYCLFSGSKFCIARICTLFVGLQIYSVERLFQLGVYDDFSNEVKTLYMYMLDYYRCFWGRLTYQKGSESFIFSENIFADIIQKFKELCGDYIDSIIRLEYNYTFWNPALTGSQEKMLQALVDDFPSIFQLKELVENKILK